MHCNVLVTINNMDIGYTYDSINTKYRILIKVWGQADCLKFKGMNKVNIYLHKLNYIVYNQKR